MLCVAEPEQWKNPKVAQGVKGMAQRAHSSLRLSIPRLVLLFITLCCVCSLGVLLRYSQLNVGDKSLGRFYPKSTLFKAREVFVLTPRRHRGQAEWIREDQTARPACERKGNRYLVKKHKFKQDELKPFDVRLQRELRGR